MWQNIAEFLINYLMSIDASFFKDSKYQMTLDVCNFLYTKKYQMSLDVCIFFTITNINSLFVHVLIFKIIQLNSHALTHVNSNVRKYHTTRAQLYI